MPENRNVYLRLLPIVPDCWDESSAPELDRIRAQAIAQLYQQGSIGQAAACQCQMRTTNTSDAREKNHLPTKTTSC